ncbi:LPXTG cell wall anchor domain-containing protein [Thermoactinomyces sp. DSM 45892]|uniref:LPXTG cell wall anchor domain-containing protein n=1 Tax=Thermoactinomyces sp. DSM 45892 TaxID=1882753 RepID=UPI000896B488|nr:LPXTG cell wall anchor domain-containing protein [Thermoactinomyces sp. DSM 45892]SDZ20106.1 LPXTG-motif cell wall anchor domain-containing protein [Thermoactinomyces sp. DSM 45892]
MARMTKPYAVLATLALSVTAFQDVVAAEETKPAPATPPTEQKETAPETKVEVKVEDTKGTEADKKAEVKPEDKKAAETSNKTEEKTGDKANDKTDGKTDGTPGETPNTNPSTPGTSKPADKKEDEAKGPSLYAKASFKDGTLTITASITNAKHIKGLWYADGYKPGSEKVSFTDEKQSQNRFTQTFTFKNVKPGVYHVAVGFIGTIDDLEVGNDEDFVVLEIDTRKGGATKPVESKATVKKAPSKKEATPEKAATEQKETKKAATNGQGGTLPKTATSYPIATVAGAAVLMVGAGLFFVARRRKQK